MANCIVQEEVTKVVVEKPKTIVLELSEDEAHLLLDITGFVLCDNKEIWKHCENIYEALASKILPKHKYYGKYYKYVKSVNINLKSQNLAPTN